MSTLKLNTASSSPSDLKSSSPTTSARNSYTSISDSSNAASSARTSYSSIFDAPVRVASFSRTSDEFIPDSASVSTVESGDEEAESESAIVEFGSKDGLSALRELENVKEIICVAFGAFDRYYISWEDHGGDFHQESHKLPSKLQQWLFPLDGRTRDIRTLQVSFGSNDEFFASDKNSKISYRDSISPPSEKSGRVTPSLANVARGVARRKAFTVSSPSPNSGLGLVGVKDGQSGVNMDEMKAGDRRVERRKTYMEGHSSLSSRGDSMKAMREPGDVPREKKNWEMKHEKRRSIFAVSEGQLKRLSRRSTFFEERPEPKIKEMPMVHSTYQLPIERGRPISRSPTRMDTGAETPKQERRRSLLINNLPIRASWPDTKTILQAKDRIQGSRTKIEDEWRPRPKVMAEYANAEVQDSKRVTPVMQQDGMSMVQYEFYPSQHVAIGAMSDFFRCQYRLGDALAFV
ncbi:hypothetical protein ACEPPN_006593 [Leptodophora sp. 'Broadleaf-Isolate-01']